MASVGHRSPGCPHKGVPRRRMPRHNHWHPVRGTDIRHNGFRTHAFYLRVRGNLENCSVGRKQVTSQRSNLYCPQAKDDLQVLWLQPGLFLVTLAGTALVRKTTQYMIAGYPTENPSNYQPSHHFFHTVNQHLLLTSIRNLETGLVRKIGKINQ